MEIIKENEYFRYYNSNPYYDSDKSILDNIAFMYNSFEIKEEKKEARKSFLNELQYEPDEEEKVLNFIEMIQDVDVEDDNN